MPTIHRLPPWHLRCIDRETMPRRAVERDARPHSPACPDQSRLGRSNVAEDEERCEEWCEDRDERDRHRRGYNNDHTGKWNVWHRRKDDHDHHDHGDRARCIHDMRKETGWEAYCEQERSPRCRTWGGGSKHGGCHHQEAAKNVGEDVEAITSVPQQLPQLNPTSEGY